MALQSKTITGSTNNSNWTWKMEVIENSTNTSANTSSVTVNSYLGRASSASYFGGNASVNITCNGTSRSASKTFTYPTNVSGGGWVLVQSETFTITHNSDGSKSINVSSSLSGADFSPSSASASGSMTLTKIPRYANITSFVVNKRDETSVTFSWSADATCDYAWYSKDNGSNWSDLPANNIVTGLSYNTTYKFKLKVRRKDSQLWTESGTYSQTTYDIPYCTETPNFTLGNKVTLKFYNPLGRSIKFYIIGNGTQINDTYSCSGTSYSGVSSSETSVPMLYATIPNAKSGKYKVKTVWGNYEWTSDYGNTYSVNENACIPTLGNITYKDSKESTIAITGDNQRIIRNHSNLLFTIGSATAKNSASISKYEVTIGATTKTRTSAGDLDFGTINLAQSTNATLKVIDSRGITNTKNINVTIDNWELPTALIEIKRKNNFYSETYFKVDGSCSSLNGKNELNIKYQYKKVSDSNYSELTAIEDNKQVTLDLDNNYQWNIKAILTDKLGTTTYNAILERGMPITYFDRAKNSVGINCFPKYDDNVELNGETLKGSIAVSSTEPTKDEEVWLKKGKNLLNTPFTEDNKYTFTATKDDHYITTNYKCYLEKDVTYTISYETDGVCGSEGDTVEIYLMKDKDFSVIWNFNRNPRTITANESGYYYLRFDINKSGATHSFWNIQVEEGDKATPFELYDREIYIKINNEYIPFYDSNEPRKYKTLYMGALYQGQSIKLSGVKTFLDVYFCMANTVGDVVSKYTIDTKPSKDIAYGSTVLLAHDSDNGLEYYVDESTYVPSTGIFTHTRTGFFNISSGTYNARTGGSTAYRIYRIETYD